MEWFRYEAVPESACCVDSNPSENLFNGISVLDSFGSHTLKINKEWGGKFVGKM